MHTHMYTHVFCSPSNNIPNEVLTSLADRFDHRPGRGLHVTAPPARAPRASPAGAVRRLGPGHAPHGRLRGGGGAGRGGGARGGTWGQPGPEENHGDWGATPHRPQSHRDHAGRRIRSGGFVRSFVRSFHRFVLRPWYASSFSRMVRTSCVTDLRKGLRKGLYGTFWSVRLLMSQLGCPEVTLCSWQDIKIHFNVLAATRYGPNWWVKAKGAVGIFNHAATPELQRIVASWLEFTSVQTAGAHWLADADTRSVSDQIPTVLKHNYSRSGSCVSAFRLV